MTVPRVLLLLCALLAVVDGDVWTGVGIALVVAVICAAWPGGIVTCRRYYVRGRWWRD